MPRTQLSRTPLSKQAGLLRTSLWLSLGLSPLACGGSTVISPNGDGGSSARAGGDNVAGALSTGGSGGSAPMGGSAPVGGSAPIAGSAPVGGSSPAGGSGAVGGSSPAGGSGAGGATTTACPNPVYNSATKLTTCSNGRAHRTASTACTFTEPPPAAGGTSGVGGTGGGSSFCTSDANCAALPYGYCRREGNAAPRCDSGCVNDSDCGVGMACACNGTNPGQCVTATCATDADCGANSLCAVANYVCGGITFKCTTAQDECITSNDCMGGTCALQDGRRACDNAVCGRPFLIAEVPRMAAIETRADWLDATLSPDASGLSPLERAQLAAHWARLGQMEHASIAAFARFSLQLLSLGAPSELVEACNRALADETAHTRACFALASAYGGTAVGPARLDIEHCFEDTSLLAIAKLVLREGCLGETVASLEALAAAEVASDPAVKRALTQIANDELQHAELAFKFLRWALTLSSVEEHHELAREAAQQLADFESDARNGEREASDERLAAHGLVAGDALRAIHLAAVRDVSRPLLAALFDVDTSSDA